MKETSANPALGKVDQTQNTEPKVFFACFFLSFKEPCGVTCWCLLSGLIFLENKRLVSNMYIQSQVLQPVSSLFFGVVLMTPSFPQ